MDATAELGRNLVSTRFSLSMEMSRLTRDGTTAEPVSRDQILRHERGQGNIHFSCSADHVQDWQPHVVDPYSCYMCDHTYTHTYDNITLHSLKIMPIKQWRTVKSLVHKIRLHGRRGKGMAESFSRAKLRHAPQKEGG